MLQGSFRRIAVFRIWKDDLCLGQDARKAHLPGPRHQWTFGVIDPARGGMAAPGSTSYEDCVLYNLAADPHQLVNLAGRHEMRAVENELRDRLRSLIIAAGEPEPAIRKRPYGLYT